MRVISRSAKSILRSRISARSPGEPPLTSAWGRPWPISNRCSGVPAGRRCRPADASAISATLTWTRSYDAHVDLEEAAAIARRHDLREGTAEFKGSGRWSLNEFTSSGALALRDLGWQDEQFAIKQASATFGLLHHRSANQAVEVAGKLLGGTVAGDAQVDNWLHSIPTPAPGKAKKGAENMPVITAARPPVKRGEK